MPKLGLYYHPLFFADSLLYQIGIGLFRFLATGSRVCVALEEWLD